MGNGRAYCLDVGEGRVGEGGVERGDEGGGGGGDGEAEAAGEGLDALLGRGGEADGEDQPRVLHLRAGGGDAIQHGDVTIYGT